jgi:hypothetical protein
MLVATGLPAAKRRSGWRGGRRNGVVVTARAVEVLKWGTSARPRAGLKSSPKLRQSRADHRRGGRPRARHGHGSRGPTRAWSGGFYDAAPADDGWVQDEGSTPPRMTWTGSSRRSTARSSPTWARRAPRRSSPSSAAPPGAGPARPPTQARTPAPRPEPRGRHRGDPDARGAQMHLHPAAPGARRTQMHLHLGAPGARRAQMHLHPAAPAAPRTPMQLPRPAPGARRALMAVTSRRTPARPAPRPCPTHRFAAHPATFLHPTSHQCCGVS